MTKQLHWLTTGQLQKGFAKKKFSAVDERKAELVKHHAFLIPWSL